MRAVVMRIRDASVSIRSRVTGTVMQGLLVYLGVGKDDTEADIDYLVDKVTNLRVFLDPEGKMNLSVRDTGGGVMVVSQFTLFGDARKGRRPSYSDAAPPEQAEAFYNAFIGKVKACGLQVASGEFRAMMDVGCVNEGPVTILLDSKRLF